MSYYPRASVIRVNDLLTHIYSNVLLSKDKNHGNKCTDHFKTHFRMSRLRTSHMHGIRRALIGGNRIPAARSSCSRTSATTATTPPPGETVFILGASSSTARSVNSQWEEFISAVCCGFKYMSSVVPASVALCCQSCSKLSLFEGNTSGY